MRIGIIGAGNIGGALTRRLCALGHQVVVANSRGPESLAPLVAETGAEAGTVLAAARAGEVVAVTIPMKNIPDLPKDLFDELGFGSVDTGSLAESWRQQSGGPVYAKDFDAGGTRRALAEARPERTAASRATPDSPGDFANPA